MFGRSVPDLQIEGRTRDLAMFNLAIDSKLRDCDIVALRVEDVAPSRYAVDRVTVRQKKTGRPVRFELTEQTRQAVDDYIKAAGKKPGEFLFSGRGDNNRCMTTRQYARLVSSWVATIGLDPHFFATHSLRRVSVLAGGGISGVSARRAECPSHGACARVSERWSPGKAAKVELQRFTREPPRIR